MFELKYKTTDKCFKNNVTIIEKLVQIYAMNNLTRTIFMHGLYPTLKESIKTEQSELHNFVQAASSNDVNLLDDDTKEKFQKVIENLDYGWDSSQMLEIKTHLGSWIGKENGASSSALSFTHMFWHISFRQNVLEDLKCVTHSEGLRNCSYYEDLFHGGKYFPTPRNSSNKNDIVRFGTSTTPFMHLSSLKLLQNDLSSFAHTVCEP